ncbi:MAG: ATP-binding protein, partial [Chloroflexota bacterium]
MTVADPPISRAPASQQLPAEVSSFIGREQELAGLKQILSESRLLTLTGPGGCGKTRLALRTAGGLRSRFADGIYFVQFAPITDPVFVSRAVSSAVGVRETAGPRQIETLIAALASRRMLLIFDNCEHLIEGCADLAERLLAAGPQLRILATSREPMRIPGEVIWRVPSLSFPDGSPPASLEDLAKSEAVDLFVDRVRSGQSGFCLTSENAPSVLAICRRLEGLPLAIELAAAQTRILTVQQIAQRLDDAVALLGGGSRTLPRHETLQATLDWSYSLLSNAERDLFRRLAVFSGGFGVGAAEGVCAGGYVSRAGVLRHLTSLVEKSLVESQLRDTEARYRLLEPVRQYAHARLLAEEEPDVWRRRHALYFLDLAECAEPELMSGRRAGALRRLLLEQENLRAALAFGRQAADRGGCEHLDLRLAAALLWFWAFRGEVSEGLEWVERALAGGARAGPEIRATALYCAAELAWLAGQNELGQVRAEESIELFRGTGQKRGLAYALQSLPMANGHPLAGASVEESEALFAEVGDEWGSALARGAVDLHALVREGDPGGSGKIRLEDGLERMRALGDGWGAAQMLNMLGDLARSRGDEPAAYACYEESLALLHREAITGTVPSLLNNLGSLALRRGKPRQSLRLFRESLALFREQGDLRGIADCLDGLAAVLVALKHAERAVLLYGSADTLREAIGAEIWPANAMDHERNLGLARGVLGDAAFAMAWASGRLLPWERAVSETLLEDTNAGGSTVAGELELTARESEVAILVSQGLTNRQIGARLVITEGTARLHVKHILQ